MVRQTPVLLVAALVGAAVYFWSTLDERPLPAKSSISVASAQLADSPSSQESSYTGERIDDSLMLRRTEAAEPVTLSSETSSLLAEQVTLRSLAENTGILLTDAQWTAFAAVTAHLQSVRQAYEANIAQVTNVQSGRYQLQIPAYPEAGDALRESLYAELREKVGNGGAQQIERYLGSALESHFAGFGVGVQTLDFVADPKGIESDYQVTRTATFWNSVEAKEGLSRRQETYLPGIEDPSGRQWGPFLSILATAVASKSGS